MNARFYTRLIISITIILNCAKAQIITSVIGYDNNGDGRPALDAILYTPLNESVDQAGNLYYADWSINRVRKIDGVTKKITSVAGVGVAGYCGDGGPAKNACLSHPTDVFVAPSGNIYISDAGNNLIRKIDVTSGLINTVAGNGINGYTGDGGPARLASIAPWRLYVDGDENIYFTDKVHYIIRKIEVNTGIIKTIAGNGQSSTSAADPSGDGGPALLATFASPYGISMDNSKNIYIADNTINRIRKIDAVTGSITSIAGGGQINADFIPAVNAKLASAHSVSIDANNNLYVGTTKNVRKINLATGIITTVAGMLVSNGEPAQDNVAATSTNIEMQHGCFVDKAGNIYITNPTMRKVDFTTGKINIIAGSGKYYTPDGLTALATSIYAPSDVSLDKDANIYFSDGDGAWLRKIDAVTGRVYTVAGKLNSIVDPNADSTTALETSINVWNIRNDTAGNVYFIEPWSIRKVDVTTGILSIITGNGFSMEDNIPAKQAGGFVINDFRFDKAGNIYLTDGSYMRIKKIDAVTGIIKNITNGEQAVNSYTGDNGPAALATFGNPYAIALDDSNNIYVSDIDFGVVRKIDAATGIITTVAGKGTKESIPTGDGGTALAASMVYPNSISVDKSGNLFINDAWGARIRKVTKSTGIINTIAGNGSEGLSGDGGSPLYAQIACHRLTMDKAGASIYITDRSNDRIRKISFNNITLCPSSASTSINSDITGSVYQWQMNTGNGYSNLNDNSVSTGSNTNVLHLNNITSLWSGYQFRCLVDGKISNTYTIKYFAQWTGQENNTWENPANWACAAVPDANTDVFINGGSSVIINSNVTVKSLAVSPGAAITVSAGNTLKVINQ